MQISVQVISEKTPKQKSFGSGYGFTFLEILVVLTLALIILGTVLPQFLAFFSKPIDKIEKGRLLVLKKCKIGWCKIKTENFVGWINTKNLWGTIIN